MKLLSSLAACLIVVTAAVAEKPAEKKADPKLQEMLVGKWEVTDAEIKGSTFEFAKDGTMKLSLKLGENKIDIDGKYKVLAEDSLEVSMKTPDGKEKTEKLKMKLEKTALTLTGPDGKALKLTKK